MEKAAIYELIVKTLHETFEIDEAKLTPQARLYEDLDIDSIDAVDLIVKMQKLTGKRMQPEAFKSVRTIEDVVDAIHQIANT